MCVKGLTSGTDGSQLEAIEPGVKPLVIDNDLYDRDDDDMAGG